MKCIFLYFTFFISLNQLVAQEFSVWIKNPAFVKPIGIIDYTKLENWAAHPYKLDSSDKVPNPLKKIYVLDSVVDVFFIHPTSLIYKTDCTWNADINDAKINLRTDEGSIKYQASIFNNQRVFAPRYRQAHISAYFTKDKKNALKSLDYAYKDVLNAFEFYLKNYNNGRPFIIASHSQGTTHAQRLIKEKIEKTDLKNRFVVGYLIGMPVAENYFKVIRKCNNANETGCFVSWRTYAQDYIEPNFVAKEKNKMAVTNPLTWTSDSSLVDKKLHKGAILQAFNFVIPKFCDVQVHDNILWIGTPNMIGGSALKMKNFHAGDYNIFYVNIRENIADRINAFWKR